MTDKYCNVCGGSGYLTVRLRYKISPVYHARDELLQDARPSSKTFACPECSEHKNARLFVCERHVRHGNEPLANILPYVKEQIAHAFVDAILRDGRIKFETREDAYDGTTVKGTIGIYPYKVKDND